MSSQVRQQSSGAGLGQRDELADENRRRSDETACSKSLPPTAGEDTAANAQPGHVAEKTAIPFPSPPYSLADLFKALNLQRRRETRRLAKDPTNVPDDYDNHARPWDAVYDIISRQTGLTLGSVRAVADFLIHDRRLSGQLAADRDRVEAWSARQNAVKGLLAWLREEYPHESAEMRLPDPAFAMSASSEGASSPSTKDSSDTGKSSKRKRRPGLGQHGNTVKKEAKKELVLRFCKEKRWDGTLSELAKALKQSTGLSISVTTLHRYVKGKCFTGGQPHTAGGHGIRRGRGEREAASFTEADDLSDHGAYTMPDDD